MQLNTVYNENCITGMIRLADESVDCCVTSPPYLGLRDYGIKPTFWHAVEYAPIAGLPTLHIEPWNGCLGLESSIEAYIGHLVAVCREIRRVLKPQGTLWLNLGDSYAGAGMGAANYPQDSGSMQETNAGSTAIKGRIAVKYGLKPKDLMMIPARAALALQADGWYLRQDVIWNKSNPMPESVNDRCTKSHEFIFMLAKSPKYYYDAEAIKEPSVQEEFANGFRGGAYCDHETFDNAAGGNRKHTGNKKYYVPAGSQGAFGSPQSRRRLKVPSGWDVEKRAHGAFHREGRGSGNTQRKYGDSRDREGSQLGASIPWDYTKTRNKRDVWTVATKSYTEAHFATFPPALIEPCILAGSPANGVVIDPFGGSGTTGYVANMNGRNYILFEQNKDYCELARKRISRAAYQMQLDL